MARWEKIADGMYMYSDGDKLYTVSQLPDGYWLVTHGFENCTVDIGEARTLDEGKQQVNEEISDRAKHYNTLTIDEHGNILGEKKRSGKSVKIGSIAQRSENVPKTILNGGVITDGQMEELIKQIGEWRTVSRATKEISDILRPISVEPCFANISTTFSAPLDATKTHEKIRRGIDLLIKESMSAEWDAKKEFDFFESVSTIKRVGPSKVFVLIRHVIPQDVDAYDLPEFFRSMQDKGLDEYAFVE